MKNGAHPVETVPFFEADLAATRRYSVSGLKLA
jgi:hypothetical protein